MAGTEPLDGVLLGLVVVLVMDGRGVAFMAGAVGVMRTVAASLTSVALEVIASVLTVWAVTMVAGSLVGAVLVVVVKVPVGDMPQPASRTMLKMNIAHEWGDCGR